MLLPVSGGAGYAQSLFPDTMLGAAAAGQVAWLLKMRLTGDGGFWDSYVPAFLQVAAMYYGVALALEFALPRLLPHRCMRVLELDPCSTHLRSGTAPDALGGDTPPPCRCSW